MFLFFGIHYGEEKCLNLFFYGFAAEFVVEYAFSLQV